MKKIALVQALAALGWVSVVPLGWAQGMPAQTDTTAMPVEALSLRAFVELIASTDESVQVQRLEERVAEESVKGAKGIYEPLAFASVDRENSFVPNTASEALQRSNQFDYWSSVNQYKTGVGFKAPSGADLEISYNLSQIQNSLQAASVLNIGSPEYRTYLGFKISQPLLRNAGRLPTEVSIRVAEQDQNVAKETVRQVLNQRIFDGLVAYMNVQRAQKRVSLRQQASDTAEKIWKEVQRQETVGLKSAGDLLDAESAANTRRLQLAQAQQDLEEQLNTFRAFIAAREREQGRSLMPRNYQASDPLTLFNIQVPGFSGSVGSGALKFDAMDPEFVKVSVESRPETRANRERIDRERVRENYAKEQQQPELNFSVRYGMEDLTARSYNNVTQYLNGNRHTPYNSWSVGLLFKMGIFGDEKRKSEYAAAQLRRQQLELAQVALEQRVANEVMSALVVLDRSVAQVKRQQLIVDRQRESLKLESALVDSGRKSALDLMKRQLDVLMAEESLADSTVVANRASFIVSQSQGILLSRMGVE